jgi:hypothetical protein
MSTVKRARGAAGLLFLLCAVALAAGLGMDFAAPSATPFWPGAQPGARAVIGAAAAALAVFGALLLRIVLIRRGADGGPQ